MNRQRHGCWVAAAVALATIAAAAAEAAAGEIRIWPSAVVTSDTVTIADLADLRGFDAPTSERLGQIVVQAAPPPGGEVLVRCDDIRAALAEANADLATIQTFGSSRCKVSKPRPPVEPKSPAERPKRTSKSNVQPRPRPAKAAAAPTRQGPAEKAGTLEAALRQFITSRVPDSGAKLEIRFSPANKQDLQLSSPEYQFQIQPRDQRTIGLLSFEIELIRNGQVERTTPIVAEVWLVKDVVVARRPINKGAVVEGRDLKLEERRFSDIEAIGVANLTAAIGQQCQRFVKPGEMISPDWLQAKTLVARGDHVTIWNRQGNLVIKTTGTAQQAGCVGEVIEVRRDGTKRKDDLIDAEVTGPGTVTLSADRQLAKR